MSVVRRNVGIGLALLALGFCVGIGVLHYRAKWAVVRYERQLRLAGEKLSIAELLPPLPMPQSNGAPLFCQVMGQLGWTGTNLLNKNAPTAMAMVAPGKAMVGSAEPGVRDLTSDQATNTWEEVATALEQYRAALDAVESAAQYPVLDFWLDYRQGFTLPLPHLAPLKRSVQLLGISALCDLHRGDPADAAAQIELALTLTKEIGGEPLVISQLVRLAMANLSLAYTWELLHSPNLRDRALAALQRDWSELDFTQPMERALVMERAMDQLTLERMRNSTAQFRQMLSLGGGLGPSPNPAVSAGQLGDEVLHEIVLGTREAHWRLSLSYPDQLRALKGFQVLLTGLRQFEAGQPFCSVAHAQEVKLSQLGLGNTDSDFGTRFDSPDSGLASLFSDSVLSQSRTITRVFLTEAGRRMTITALALKRYQLGHGEYPASLAALVPEFLASVPLDPADGKPLRYRLQPNGDFVLYSMGVDGTDDGGDPLPRIKTDSFAWSLGRDLVWPRLATKAEAAAFAAKWNHRRRP